MVYKLFSWLFFKRKTEEKRNTENLKDCATLSLLLTKHLNSQLRFAALLIKVFCALADVFAGAAAKNA